jgi:hypothetical protein
LLSEAKLEKLKSCEKWTFYQLIFRQIPEQEFAVLFSEKDSPPERAGKYAGSGFDLKTPERLELPGAFRSYRL